MPAVVEVELDDLSCNQPQEPLFAPSQRINNSVTVHNTTSVIIAEQSSDCSSACTGFLAGLFCGPFGCLCGFCSNNKVGYYFGYFFPSIFVMGFLVFLCWILFSAVAVGSSGSNSNNNPSPIPNITPSATPSKRIQEIPHAICDSGSPSQPTCLVGESSSFRVSSTAKFGSFFINQIADPIKVYYYNATVFSTNSSHYSIGWYEYGCYTETSTGCSSSNIHDYRYIYEDTITGNAVVQFFSSVQYSPYSFGAISPVIKCHDFLACDITVSQYVSCSQGLTQ